MIRDRDGIYCEKFHGRVEGMVIEQVLTVPRSPTPNGLWDLYGESASITSLCSASGTCAGA